MHPERGPVVFTTQDQLFAHFAEEHANPENKGDEVGIISSQKFGIPSFGQENNDTRLIKLRHSNMHPTIPSSKEQILTIDNTKNLEGTELVLGDTLQDTVTPKILISTPPQLHHSCPVCHKVIICYSNTHSHFAIISYLKTQYTRKHILFTMHQILIGLVILL